MSHESDPFVDRSAVVTGASSGIGSAIALELARLGARHILVHYRTNRDGAEATAAKIRDLGCEASLCAADISVADDAAKLVDHAITTLGSIDTWVNNAGADVLTGEAEQWDFATKLQRLFDVDVVGTIRLSRLVADQMRRQTSNGTRSGPAPSIVFIGWDQSGEGMEGDAGQMFGPVKAAVTAFAASLAQEQASIIRVNTVAPGWIRTSWGESTSEYWDQRAKAQSLVGRWGTPDDVARAVAFLASPDNSFIHGQTINVNGGWNRRFDVGDQS